MFEYKIDVIKTLKEKGYNTTRIRKEKLLSEKALQQLRKNEIVGIISLEKICYMLNMQPGSIIRYIPDEEKLKTKTPIIMEETKTE